MRAIAYLSLVKVDGNLPIILDGMTPTGDEQRATVLENYKHIEEDLLFADANLPAPGATANVGRVSSSVAKTALSTDGTEEYWNSMNLANLVPTISTDSIIRRLTQVDPTDSSKILFIASAEDGGTRTASITGAFVALSLSINKLLAKKKISKNPIKDFIAGVSCGIVNGEILVDLDYSEDSNAEVDANFVFTKNSGISEIQISGEKNPFPSNSIQKMIISCEKAAKQIFEIQKRIISPVE